MDILNKIKFLDKLSLSDMPSVRFFQTDATRYAILLIIFEKFYKKELISIEGIIEKLPKNISSRAHQLSFLKSADLKGYLIKEISKSDNRIKYLKPSLNLARDFKTHTDLFNQFLKDTKDH